MDVHSGGGYRSQFLPTRVGLSQNSSSSSGGVLDAIDFVVHLFSKEQRENYALEDLWKDALNLEAGDL